MVPVEVFADNRLLLLLESGLILSRNACNRILVGNALIPSSGIVTSSRQVGQAMTIDFFWTKSCKQSRQNVC